MYVDGGTFSIILQAIIGTFLASVVLVKIYWNRVKSFIKRIFGIVSKE